MNDTRTPGFLRRLGGVLYESLTIVALWLLGSAIFTSVYGPADTAGARLLLQGICLVLISSYFLWCWAHGGQTLAMRAWRIRVTYQDGAPLSAPGAGLRYLLAVAGITLVGVGFWWAWLDRDGQFLHDRLAKTRLNDLRV